MSKWRPLGTIPIHALIILVASAANPSLVFAQGSSAAMPENARANSYGSGWECDRGYRNVDQACVVVMVPQNGYLNTSGDRWECDRGYRRVKESCVAIKVPTAERFKKKEEKTTSDLLLSLTGQDLLTCPSCQVGKMKRTEEIPKDGFDSS